MTDPRSGVVRIAMWSGPRNLSTALMRSFENRTDTLVADEPFYAAYLAATGLDHPMREEVIASQPTDWRKVAEGLLAPAAKPVFYQKHMTHHILPEFGHGWMEGCRHAFLIRRPERVLASYAVKRQEVRLSDIGFVEQAELYDEAAAMAGAPPPVIDADVLLSDPPRVLRRLCEALGIPFDEKMLSWPPGPRESDGVWGPHWYDSVKRSTGFATPAPPPRLSDPVLLRIAEQALPLYEKLARHAIA
jgi:hypothetical protein